jgi:inosine/xanthosine triphosphate pyrophosphatase family protein
MAAALRKIVLASRNPDKLRELREVCAGAPFEIVAAADYPGLPDIVEDGTTVLGNACRKAIVTAAYTGEIAVGDDTAFQVAALNNLPDVFASRFGGPGASYADNAELVLELMGGVADEFRQARFVTAAVWVDPRPAESGLGARPPLPPGVEARWLHNPFARAIHVKDLAQEDAFWNALIDRRAIWEGYRARWGSILVTHGADEARLSAVLDRLLAPLIGGVRPADAAAGTIRLPDTRIWTASGPVDAEADAGASARASVVAVAGDEPPTLVTPSGLPADAPGLAVNLALWFEVAAEGRLLGTLGREPVGFGGFGYDPIFKPGGLDRTLAELEAEEKNAISHRGRALRRLLDAVGSAYGVHA